MVFILKCGPSRGTKIQNLFDNIGFTFRCYEAKNRCVERNISGNFKGSFVLQVLKGEKRKNIEKSLKDGEHGGGMAEFY
ncbi:MAG: hypothetical protein IKW98_13040 [Prevotella sp.]|nr:hypothetical protein [Prevotella sp.]